MTLLQSRYCWSNWPRKTTELSNRGHCHRYSPLAVADMCGFPFLSCIYPHIWRVPLTLSSQEKRKKTNCWSRYSPCNISANALSKNNFQKHCHSPCLQSGRGQYDLSRCFPYSTCQRKLWVAEGSLAMLLLGHTNGLEEYHLGHRHQTSVIFSVQWIWQWKQTRRKHSVLSHLLYPY